MGMNGWAIWVTSGFASWRCDIPSIHPFFLSASSLSMTSLLDQTWPNFWLTRSGRSIFRVESGWVWPSGSKNGWNRLGWPHIRSKFEFSLKLYVIKAIEPVWNPILRSPQGKIIGSIWVMLVGFIWPFIMYSQQNTDVCLKVWYNPNDFLVWFFEYESSKVWPILKNKYVQPSSFKNGSYQKILLVIEVSCFPNLTL